MCKRIEICGGIAAGKSSLAKVLEEEGFIAVYERMEDNPFLKDFYMRSDIDNTFETEVACTLLHYNWIKSNLGNSYIVCDYSLFQDFCYGINNLNRKDLKMYKELYEYVLSKVSCADLTVYLRCNVDCLLERIKTRGREMEQDISKEYLESNIAVIEKELVKQPNILIIESDKYNFIEQDRKYIIEKIMKHFKG